MNLDAEIRIRLATALPSELFTAAVVHEFARFSWVKRYLGAGEIYIGSERFDVEVDRAGTMFMPEQCVARLRAVLMDKLVGQSAAA